MNILEIIRTKNWIKLSGFVTGFALIILLAGTVLPASAAGIEASREISSGTAYAGGSFTVTVHIKTDQQIEALVLDENLPDGWQVSQIENNGAVFQDTSTFKESSSEWIWVENLSAGAERNVTYQVTVPSYPEPGSYKISGRTSAYSISLAPVNGSSEVIVTYAPPEAMFSATPVSGSVPLTVQFTDLSTGNPDSWEWDFDGNGSVDSREKNPVYTYGSTGAYTVTLKVTNSTYGNDTETKAGYITVKSKTSSSGGSGGGSGGGGAGSPESSKNVELKEVSNEQVFKGSHTCYTFKGGKNDIVSIEFDPKKNFGKTTTIIEILKNTSTIVKEPAPRAVYKNINIWVGNSGFSSSENLENARINFRVNKTWISENNINESSIVLYRYNENKWNKLPAVLNKEDEDYLYFSSETPGFSPFVISGMKKDIAEIQTKNEDKMTLKGSNQPEGEGQTNLDSNLEKEEGKEATGIGAIFVATEILISYVVLKRRK